MMDKSGALVQGMAILNEGGILMFGSYEYKAVMKWVSSMIDELGPEGALEQIKETKTLLYAEIEETSY